MDHKYVSSKGGRSTKRKYGKGHYSAMGKRSAEVRMEKYGTEGFLQLSRLGVEARKRKAEAKKGMLQKVMEKIASV